MIRLWTSQALTIDVQGRRLTAVSFFARRWTYTLGHGSGDTYGLFKSKVLDTWLRVKFKSL